MSDLELMTALESVVGDIEQGYWLDGLGCDDFRPELVWCHQHGSRAARLLTRLVHGPRADDDRDHWDRQTRWDATECWAGDDDVRLCHFCDVVVETGGVLEPDYWWRCVIDEEYTPNAAELLIVADSMMPDSVWWSRWREAAGHQLAVVA